MQSLAVPVAWRLQLSSSRSTAVPPAARGATHFEGATARCRPEIRMIRPRACRALSQTPARDEGVPFAACGLLSRPGARVAGISRSAICTLMPSTLGTTMEHLPTTSVQPECSSTPTAHTAPALLVHCTPHCTLHFRRSTALSITALSTALSTTLSTALVHFSLD